MHIRFLVNSSIPIGRFSLLSLVNQHAALALSVQGRTYTLQASALKTQASGPLGLVDPEARASELGGSITPWRDPSSQVWRPGGSGLANPDTQASELGGSAIPGRTVLWIRRVRFPFAASRWHFWWLPLRGRRLVLVSVLGAGVRCQVPGVMRNGHAACGWWSRSP
jgi:hypothetical protein